MTTAVAAAVWLIAGAAAGLAGPRLHVRRLAVGVPLAGLVAAVVAGSAGGTNALAGGVGLGGLDRAGQGLMIVASASLAAVLLVTPTLDGTEALVIGWCGAAAMLALGSSSLAVRAAAFLAAVGVISLRWVTVAPGRRTLSAGRAAGAGAAALLAAAVFQPLPRAAEGVEPVLVGILVAGGLAALLALLPLGGWATAGFDSLRGIDVAPWQLLVAPAVLLTAEALPPSLPAVAVTGFNQLLLVTGLFTALWSGWLALRAPAARRYGRAYIADLALAVAAVGTGHAEPALAGGLIIVVTHLVLAPVLLPSTESVRRRPARAAWALLSGVPPSPSFWARFMLLEAFVQADPALLFVALPAVAASFITAVVAAIPFSARDGEANDTQSRWSDATGWMLVGAAIAVGLAPSATAAFIFGGR